MTIFGLFIFVALWVACGTIAYSAALSYFQNEYPDSKESDFYLDRRGAITQFICGPAGLLVTMFCSHFFKHGFMFNWRSPHDR